MPVTFEYDDERVGEGVIDHALRFTISRSQHDPRWDDDAIGDLKQIPGYVFEVVSTGPVIR